MSRIITITSGKGGVGKTNISLNLALHLARMGHSVCLFDADFGLANVNLLLKLYPEHNLKDVILNGMDLSEIVIHNYQGIDIIPGSSGVEEMANLNPEQIAGLINGFSRLDAYDFFIIDTAAGVSRDVMSFCLASSEILLVITPDPTSLTDAYALLKILSLNGYTDPVMIAVNQSPGINKAKAAISKLSITAKKFLSLKLRPVGVIGRDPCVTKAVEAQKPFLALYPKCPAAKNIQKLADNIIRQDSGEEDGVPIETFWERCLAMFKSPLKTINKKPVEKKSPPDADNAGQPSPPAVVAHEEATHGTLPVADTRGNEDIILAEKMMATTNQMLNKVVESIAAVTTELKSIRQLIEAGNRTPDAQVPAPQSEPPEDTAPTGIMIDRLTELMSGYAMCQALEDHEIRDIVSRLKIHKFNPGDFIIKKGEAGKNLFIIISGKVDVIDDHGIVLDSMKEEDVFGEMSLISGDPVNASIKVTEPAQVLYMSGKDFIHTLHAYPPLQMYFARLLSKRLSGRLEKANIAKAQYLESGLTGKLDETSAPELLQMLNTGQKTGILTFYLKNGTGTISFNQGRVVHAAYNGQGDQDAFFDILRDSGEGRFSYHSDIPPDHRNNKEIGHFMRMLIEGLSRIDDARFEDGV